MAIRIEEWLGKNAFVLSADPLYTAVFQASEFCAFHERVYLTNEGCGMELTFDEALCLQAIHLTPSLPECARAHPYPLPFALRFEYSRQLVQARLAHVAKKEGGGVVHPRLGLIPVWECYFPAGYFLHVEYTPSDERIKMLTLSLQIPGG